jgi:hypothetical protein
MAKHHKLVLEILQACVTRLRILKFVCYSQGEPQLIPVPVVHVHQPTVKWLLIMSLE